LRFLIPLFHKKKNSKTSTTASYGAVLFILSHPLILFSEIDFLNRFVDIILSFYYNIVNKKSTKCNLGFAGGCASKILSHFANECIPAGKIRKYNITVNKQTRTL
jgi:hypothetical protein